MKENQLKVLNEISINNLCIYLKYERHTAFIVWQKDDVKQVAKDLKINITEKQIENVLADINKNSDCNDGITWYTIAHYVREVTNNN